MTIHNMTKVALIQILLICFPWRLRRHGLNFIFGYKIHAGAKIGFSLILTKQLDMEENSKIGHLNLVRNIELLKLENGAIIGRTNYISGYINKNTKSFSAEPGRSSQLILGRESAITNSHHIDCTASVRVGEFCTIAGYHSQILTHSVDLKSSKQISKDVCIGRYSFIGTRSVILPGCNIPDGSVIAAGTVVTNTLHQVYSLYGGIPAKFIKEMGECDYYTRSTGAIE